MMSSSESTPVPAASSGPVTDVFAELDTALRRAAARAEPEAGSAQVRSDPLSTLIERIDAELRGMPDPGGSAPPVPLEAPGEVESVLRFVLAGRAYTAPSSQLVELTPVPEITRVPGMPDFVRGLANFRGEIIEVVDPRRWKPLEQTTAGPAPPARASTNRMVVVRVPDGRSAGLIVDASLGIATAFLTHLPAATAEGWPGDLPTAMAPFLLAMAELGGEQIPVVDLASLARASEAEATP